VAQNYNFIATDPGSYNLVPVPDCWIELPRSAFQFEFEFLGRNVNVILDQKIELYSLPEITDAKEAIYSDQTIQGRSSPVKTYSYSSNRTISFTIHLYVTTKADIRRNLGIIRAISALTHPEYNNTYLPPKVAKMKCGKLLGNNPISVILRSYEITYETEVQWFWDEEIETYMPLHVSIPTQWDVVYDWKKLPGHDDVIKGNY